MQIIFIASFADLFLVNLLVCPDLKGLHPSGLRNISVPRNLKETKDLDIFFYLLNRKWKKNSISSKQTQQHQMSVLGSFNPFFFFPCVYFCQYFSTRTKY